MTRLTALIVDYGGVLTTSLGDAMTKWIEAEGIDAEVFRSLMREWLAADASPNIAHDLETGRISAAEFERRFVDYLVRTDGTKPEAAGLLDRMLAGLAEADGMVGVVRRARAAGLKTALLSNSWGNEYDRSGWGELFDAVVISGEVGMRKPEPEIYRYAARQLGVSPRECVFVDDLAPNVRGAAAVGMVGVHHTDLETTLGELDVLFGVSLRGAGPAE